MTSTILQLRKSEQQFLSLSDISAKSAGGCRRGCIEQHLDNLRVGNAQVVQGSGLAFGVEGIVIVNVDNLLRQSRSRIICVN